MTFDTSLASLCPTLDSMIRTQQAVGRTGRTHYARASLSTTNNLRMLHGLMRRLRPEKTLEIGLSFGGSALALCASHRNFHVPNHQHVAIDPFQKTQWDECGLIAIEQAGLSDYLDFRAQISAIELPAMMSAGSTFGLIYVDGSHLFEDVFIDTYYCARMLTENGVITFDDSTDAHVSKVIRFIRSNMTLSLRELNLSEYTERRWRYSIARALNKTQLTAFQRIGPVNRQWDTRFERF